MTRMPPSDEAVSPVIGVLLMVAIGGACSVTVYVWASSFAPSGAPAAHSASLSSASALVAGAKTYVVASAGPGLRWGDITLSVNNVPRSLDTTGTCPASPSSPNVFLACGGNTLDASGAPVTAGHTLALGGVAAGQMLRLVDANANSVLTSLTVR